MNKELEICKLYDRLVLAELNIKSLNRALKTKDHNGDLGTFELRFDGEDYTYWYKDELCSKHTHDVFNKRGLTLKLTQYEIL